MSSPLCEGGGERGILLMDIRKVMFNYEREVVTKDAAIDGRMV
jgi:hypothetical protein